MDSERYDVDELQARIAAEMWRQGWVGDNALPVERVVATFRATVPEWWAESVVQNMVEDDDSPLRTARPRSRGTWRSYNSGGPTGLPRYSSPRRYGPVPR